jgi:beta-aspartyl-peptidase (threonine type)
MILIGSSNAAVGMEEGLAVLKAGGSALDAVEATIRAVESNPEDHTVGVGGLPNLLGIVELDASIMDGETLAAGAVGGVTGFPHPISIARRVMTDLPHSLLVGAGAERFARECGFEPAELLTPTARAVYERGLAAGQTEGRWEDPILRAVAGRLALDPERAHGNDTGTVNVLAIDGRGRLASGVSTSGFAWKYPGRVGDSAVIGAGNYCDGRFGAAACTGRGEMAIRAATAHSVVAYLRQGLSVVEAGRRAMEDLGYLVDPFWSAMNCVVLAPDGRHAAFATVPGRTYACIEDDPDRPGVQILPRIHVDVGGRTTTPETA